MLQQNTIIIHPFVKNKDEKIPKRTLDNKLEEAIGLAQAINLEIKIAQIITINKILPSTYIGKGKAEEFAQYIKNNEINLFIVDDNISPIQQRNLENLLQCKVIDRTALILEIFGERARTKEGVLQVELASLEYQKSRLVRSWTHLERQRGGKGAMSGPGEKQIESDKRMIRDKITRIKKQLEKVTRTRTLHRESRKKIPYQIVSLVGYTNSGKSTLFNLLTKASVYAKDQLFATLDPTMRLIKLPSGRKIILSDTVGFISNLPTQLIAAFRATLEEVIHADLLLHVRDICAEDSNEQKHDVINIVNDLGLDNNFADTSIEVLNKIDMYENDIENLKKSYNNKDDACIISAKDNLGISRLLNLIDQHLSKDNKIIDLKLELSAGKILAWLHQNANIIEQVNNLDENCTNLKVSISDKNLGKLNKML